KYMAPAILAVKRGDASTTCSVVTTVLMLTSTFLLRNAARSSGHFAESMFSVESLSAEAIGRASDGDHDLAFRVPCFEIADRLRCLAEGIASIDHRRDLAGFQQLFHEPQILLARIRHKGAQRLAPHPGNHRTKE